MNTIQLFIPKTDNDGSDNHEVIETAIMSMIDLHGGCTTLDAKGYWKDSLGALYADDITIVQAATEVNTESGLYDLAKSVLDMTDQKAVFINDNGKASIIEK